MIGFDNINELMKQEVSRKDFLRYIGVALLTLIGVAGVLKNLETSLGGSKAKEINTKPAGYGASAYGR
jgi:hypothetical protein